MKPIEDAWKKFEVMVVPNDAGPVQHSEMRKAFYAGASVLFRILTDRISSDEEPTEQDMRLMDDIAKEVDEFGQELDAAVLKGRGFKA